MKIEAYAFTVNKNNPVKLNPDELKDVIQDVQISLFRSQRNDFLTKKEILKHYQRAVEKKLKAEKLAQEMAYLESADEEGSYQTEMKRREQIDQLSLNNIQKKIVELLVSGFNYAEIRKKLKLGDQQLRQHVKRIKQQNTR